MSIFGLVAVWKDFLWPLLAEYGYTPTRETLSVGVWQASNGATPVNLIIAASAIAPTLTGYSLLLTAPSVRLHAPDGRLRPA